MAYAVPDVEFDEAMAVKLTHHPLEDEVFTAPEAEPQHDGASRNLAGAPGKELPCAAADIVEINHPPCHGLATGLRKVLADNRGQGVIL
jgi:hypothetical protein